jgi:pimeloyl-ACP methyl ester carboxylesterase
MRTPSDTPLVGQWGDYRRRRRRQPMPRGAKAAVWAVVVVSLGAATWLVVRPHPWRPPSGGPAFSACTYGGEVSAWCGSVSVPEDPRRPDGPTIALRVAVVPATSRPAAGALFYLEGGPGVPATQSAVRVNDLFAEVARDRDLVMVDERGTGGSAPLECPDAQVPASDPAAVAAYLRGCFAQLPRDPRLYTTAVAADDLEAVRRALGYGRIDIYGGSYGVTLAEAFLRLHPQSVRTVVLDSGSLPSVRIYEESARNAQRALDAVLARCAAQPACRRAYPRTRSELAELLSRPPRRVATEHGVVTLRPDDVAWTVDALSETADGATTIPFTVDAAARGAYLPLAHAFQAEVGADLDARDRLAAVWEVLCSEPWAAMDPGATARASSGSYLAHAALARALLFRRACGVVPKGRVLPAARSPVVSRAPVLLLAGGADPLDPAANLRGWRTAFPDGRLVVVAGAGHGAIDYGCVPVLVARFVARGGARGLDASCVRRAALPPFETG